MQSVRVKRIYAADFRKSIRTLYNEVKKSRKLWMGPLEDGEAYVFVSTSGNKICFVTGEREVVTHPGTIYEAKRMLLDFRGWRIEGGTFSPNMLEDYANAVGLTLGKKTFAEQWEERHG